MSEHLPHNGSPQSSPASSTGRVLSRPHWPWSTYSHRSSPSSLSTHSTGTTRPETWDQRPSSGSSSSNTMWLSTNTPARRAATGAPVASASQYELTRHWSFTVSSNRSTWSILAIIFMSPRLLSGLSRMLGSFEILWRVQIWARTQTAGPRLTGAVNSRFSESLLCLVMENINLK